MKKSIIIIFIFTFLFIVNPGFAHVTVKPSEVGVGERVNFAVSVPTEEDTPTVQVRLVIPNGLQSVRPNVKPGWNIEIKTKPEGMKDDTVNTGEEAPRLVTEIIWSGGSIPADQRDEFMFSAQVPAEEAVIAWKAYQTYSNGDVVAWENDPNIVAEHTENNPPKEGEGNHNALRPYSETKVINDLNMSENPGETKRLTKESTALTLSIVALLLSVASVVISVRRK